MFNCADLVMFLEFKNSRLLREGGMQTWRAKMVMR